MSIGLVAAALWTQAVLANPIGLKTSVATAAAACQWPQAAAIIYQAPHELHQSWSFAEAAAFWSGQLPASASLAAFRHEVSLLIPELEPQAYARAHPPADDVEAYNKILAISGRVGDLQPISCLEALLLSAQTDRLPMLKSPSEFGAFLLRRPEASGNHAYRVYFSTQDQPGLRMNAQVMAAIERDQQAGWTVWAHLHNHNFFLGQADPFAYPSPSKTDIEFARMMRQGLKLENLWITNGFHTLHLGQREFYVYRGHSDGP